MDEEVSWRCERCGKDVTAPQTRVMVRPPTVLMVHLSRAGYKHGIGAFKLDADVTILVEEGGLKDAGVKQRL